MCDFVRVHRGDPAVERRSPLRRPSGFTIVELLVVIGILVLLMALLLPAVQSAREAGRRTQCKNNLKQLALATHSFERNNNSLPPYFWYHPAHGNTYGSWFVFLLPYIDQAAAWDAIDSTQDVPSTDGANSGLKILAPAIPGTPGTPGAGYIPPTPPRGPACIQWDCNTSGIPESHIGHSTVITRTDCHCVQTDPNDPGSPGSPGNPGVGGTPGTPGTPAVLGGFCGIDLASSLGTGGLSFMTCPNDPTVPPNGATYFRWNLQWGVTSYQANWHALSDEDPAAAPYNRPQKFGLVGDGLSNTILFGEGFSHCDGTWRFQFFSPTTADYGQNVNADFGLNWLRESNTYMFQMTHHPRHCNNWRLQGMHHGLNVAMLDGSARTLSSAISRKEISDPVRDGGVMWGVTIMGTVNGVWDRMVLPNDGEPLSTDAGDWH